MIILTDTFIKSARKGSVALTKITGINKRKPVVRRTAKKRKPRKRRR